MAFTFRPSKEAAKALEKIKKGKQIATCSKVIEYVLTRFLSLEKELSETRAELSALKSEFASSKWTIIRKQEADMDFKRMVQVFENDRQQALKR